eukprot:2028617-Pyramimonas_sp.AAC.1
MQACHIWSQALTGLMAILSSRALLLQAFYSTVVKKRRNQALIGERGPSPESKHCLGTPCLSESTVWVNLPKCEHCLGDGA